MTKLQKAFIAPLILMLGVAFVMPTSSFAQEKKVETYTFTRILKQGTYGKDVFTLQTILADLDLYGGFRTGIFGPRTTATVNEFKKTRELPTNGIVDSATIDALSVISPRPIEFNDGTQKETEKKKEAAAKVEVNVLPSQGNATPEVSSAAILAPGAGVITTLSVEPEISAEQVVTGEPENDESQVVARECFVSATDEIIECDTEPAFLQYVGKVQNKRAVIRIFGKYLTADSVITLKPIVEGKPSKWMLNVGNSKYNDGWGGGSAQDPYNAEFQVVDGILGVFKGDNANKILTGAKTLFARDISNSFEGSEMKISQGQFELITKTDKPVVVKDRNLFVFETDDKEQKDVYIGLNRTIFDGDRNGSGIKGVMITITNSTTTETKEVNADTEVEVTETETPDAQ